MAGMGYMVTAEDNKADNIVEVYLAELVILIVRSHVQHLETILACAPFVLEVVVRPVRRLYDHVQDRVHRCQYYHVCLHAHHVISPIHRCRNLCHYAIQWRFLAAVQTAANPVLATVARNQAYLRRNAAVTQVFPSVLVAADPACQFGEGM